MIQTADMTGLPGPIPATKYWEDQAATQRKRGSICSAMILSRGDVVRRPDQILWKLGNQTVEIKEADEVKIA